MSWMRTVDCALDIGSERVRVFLRGRGVLLDEAVDNLVDRKAFCDRAQLLNSVVKTAFARLGLRTRWFPSVRRVVMAIPCETTDVEKQICENSVRATGVKEVFFLDSQMAAAMGSSCIVAAPKASWVVDIGLSQIQAAVISLGGTVACVNCALSASGDCGSVQVIEAMRHVIKDCLYKGLANLVDDLAEKGVVLTGDGAETPGLAKVVSEALNCPVLIADNPRMSVIEGAGRILTELDGI